MQRNVQENRFDTLAKEWDAAPHHVERTLDVAARIRERVPLSGKRALEVGAGTGLLSFALAGDLAEIVAVDPSQGMVEALEGKIRSGGIANVRAARCGDDLSGIDGEFDVAMLQMALHHIPDVDGFLSRMHDRIRPGGRLAIADLDSEDGTFHGPEVDDVHHGFDRLDLVEKLAAAGFQALSVETVHSMRRAVGNSVRDYPIFLVTAMRN